jgi:hypothetical protein
MQLPLLGLTMSGMTRKIDIILHPWLLVFGIPSTCLLSFLSPFIQVLPANIRNSFIVVLLTGLV